VGAELPEVIGYTIIVTSQVLVGGRSFDPSVRRPGVTCQPPGVARTRNAILQCLPSASATHFLIALCCAHNDISLYFACSLTSARQVAVACFTAALLGWSSALANVGAKRRPQATMVAGIRNINDCP
jgi:hypothetical protein